MHPNSRFLKMSFNQVWSGSVIAPPASLVVWQQYRTFNGNGNYASKFVLYLICKVLPNGNQFVANEGKSLTGRVFIEPKKR